MIKNFLFHRVHPERDILWDPMNVDLFDSCLKYITRNYSVILFEELMQDPANLKKKSATIMFDDGYKDNIEFALPVLEKYKIKASFYVVTESIDRNIPTWTYILDYSFMNTKNCAINLDFKFLPDHLRVNFLASKEHRIAFAKKLKPAMKRISHDERQVIMQSVLDGFDDVNIPELMMNWSDLRQLTSLGHYIGSHTVTHAMLGTMNNEGEVKKELTLSAERIKQELGFFPLTISYPVGSYNTVTKRLSEEAGYKFGLAVKQEPFRPEFHDNFEIPRMELYNENWIKTSLRIHGFPKRLTKILKRK